MKNKNDNPYKTDSVEERTIFGIENNNGEKFVHFYGYGYYADDGTETPYRFVEYTFCYVPLRKVY